MSAEWVFGRRPFLALAAVLACVSPAVAGTVAGPTRGAQVIWISDRQPPGALQGEMRNKDKTFVPPLLVVPAGSDVRFPNDDPFYHSIYSISPAGPFDIGYYGTGPGKVVTFSHAGIVEVHCHIHVTMDGTIVVVDGPSVRPTGARFSLPEIPRGTWILHFWSHRSGEKTTRVTVH